jgi:membrane protein YqaA with SNARE-associated domain
VVAPDGLAPVGGDALTFIAGLMRVRFGVFLVLTAIGKGARYGILLGAVDGVSAVLAALC